MFIYDNLIKINFYIKIYKIYFFEKYNFFKENSSTKMGTKLCGCENQEESKNTETNMVK